MTKIGLTFFRFYILICAVQLLSKKVHEGFPEQFGDGPPRGRSESQKTRPDNYDGVIIALVFWCKHPEMQKMPAAAIGYFFAAKIGLTFFRDTF